MTPTVLLIKCEPFEYAMRVVRSVQGDQCRERTLLDRDAAAGNRGGGQTRAAERQGDTPGAVG